MHAEGNGQSPISVTKLSTSLSRHVSYYAQKNYQKCFWNFPRPDLRSILLMLHIMLQYELKILIIERSIRVFTKKH